MVFVLIIKITSTSDRSVQDIILQSNIAVEILISITKKIFTDIEKSEDDLDLQSIRNWLIFYFILELLETSKKSCICIF